MRAPPGDRSSRKQTEQSCPRSPRKRKVVRKRVRARRIKLSSKTVAGDRPSSRSPCFPRAGARRFFANAGNAADHRGDVAVSVVGVRLLRANSAPSLATPVGPLPRPIEAPKAAVHYFRNTSTPADKSLGGHSLRIERPSRAIRRRRGMRREEKSSRRDGRRGPSVQPALRMKCMIITLYRELRGSVAPRSVDDDPRLPSKQINARHRRPVRRI